MANKKQGRPEINTISINRELFNSAMNYQNTNLTKLSSIIGISRKTLQRIRNDQKTNSEMLDTIAKHLNVDPYWLTGQTLEIIPSLKYNKKYMDPANHPYSEIKEQQKTINSAELLNNILILHGISKTQYDLLSEKQRHGFQMQLSLAIQIVIFSYFSPIAPKDDPFLSNEELYKLSSEVLNTEAYKKLFKLLMI